MKKTIIIAAIALAAAVSCTKEPVYSCNPGDEIQFCTGRTLGALGTKTAYGSDGWSGTNDRRIDWKNNDKITIVCNECDGVTKSDYVITGATSSGTAGLKIDPSSTNLLWGTGSHTFYVSYPSSVTFAESIGSYTGTITASVAATQTGEASGTSSAYVVTPEMTSQVLVSKKVTSPVEEGISLDFTPLSTAIKMQITNNRGAAIQVASIALQSTASQNLSGDFTADMSGWTQAFSPYTYPTCTAAGSNTTEVKITTTDGTNDYLEVADKGTLTATFFLLPTADLYDLKFVITFSDDSTLSTVIKRTDGADDTANRVTFPVHKKSYVNGILVPKGINWTSVYARDNEDYIVEDSLTGETYWK